MTSGASAAAATCAVESFGWGALCRSSDFQDKKLEEITQVMRCLTLILLFSTVLLSHAQQSPSQPVHTPGDIFSFDLAFQDAIPNIESLGCKFVLQGQPKADQQDFLKEFYCTQTAEKQGDAQHWHGRIQLPEELASGDYKLASITLTVDDVQHTYQGSSLPAAPSLTVNNPRTENFPPLTKVELK